MSLCSFTSDNSIIDKSPVLLDIFYNFNHTSSYILLPKKKKKKRGRQVDVDWV